MERVCDFKTYTSDDLKLLGIKTNNFYTVSTSVDGMEFVTAEAGKIYLIYSIPMKKCI